MAGSVHPPSSPGPLPRPSAAAVDPYAALGLGHDASQAQVKAAYRSLALQYHPDRHHQGSGSPPAEAANNGAVGSSAGGDQAEALAREAREATAKFAEIAAAYAVLSDPEKKGEYDHLYKFGAFDCGTEQSPGGGATAGDHAGSAGSGPNTNTYNMNYRYTEDYSGGYYRKDFTPMAPPTQQQQRAAAAAAWAQQFQRMQSQDSFFDDLIHSPRSKEKPTDTEDADNPIPTTHADDGTDPQRKTKPGIGFSFAPLGKHLSVHVPSRNEVMTSVARGERSHLFGTRVTYSQQTTSGIGPCGVDTTCGGESLPEKKVVCQTTRIAGGRKRMVKRTAHLRPDGTKEVVIEEEGVVIRRYVEETPTKSPGNESADPSEDGSNDIRGEDGEVETGEGGGLQKGNKFSLLGLFRSCLAPCMSAG